MEWNEMNHRMESNGIISNGIEWIMEWNGIE